MTKSLIRKVAVNNFYFRELRLSPITEVSLPPNNIRYTASIVKQELERYLKFQHEKVMGALIIKLRIMETQIQMIMFNI